MNEQTPSAIVSNPGMQPGRNSFMSGLQLHHPPNMMRRPPPPYFNRINVAPGKTRYPGPPVVPTRTNMSTSNQPFGWTNVDNVSVPYIMRGTVKFVSVKMVESNLLSKFPKINMDDMNNVGPIYSYYISDTEAKLLTEISKHYNRGTGVKQFSTKDLIVSLQDFEAFYNRAKQHFTGKNSKQVNRMKIPAQNRMQETGNLGILSRVPQSSAINMPFSVPRSDIPIPINITPSMPTLGGSPGLNNLNVPLIPSYKPALSGANGGLSPQQLADVRTVNSVAGAQMSIPQIIDGGWVQINNTVVPYLLRSGVKFVPLSVIKYAAGLLTDVRINGYKLPVSEEEFEFLNEACKSAGVNFTFSLNTKIIKLELVIRMSHSKVVIHELPEQDPFTHAQWSDEYGGNKAIGGMKPSGPINVITPTGVHAMPPKNPFIHKSLNSATQGLKVNNNLHLMPTVSSMSLDFMSNGALSRQLQTPSPSISPRVSASVVGSGIVSSIAASNSRPSSTQSRSSITPPPSPNFAIKSLHFEGKTVSCLIRKGEKEPLALLEALVRLYFTQCSLSDFQTALEKVLQVPIQQLTEVEEAAFISFYGLRVKTLRCKSVMSFDKFQSFYVQLKYIFANKVDTVSTTSVKQNQRSASSLFAAKASPVENNNNKVIKNSTANVELPVKKSVSNCNDLEDFKEGITKSVKTTEAINENNTSVIDKVTVDSQVKEEANDQDLIESITKSVKTTEAMSENNSDILDKVSTDSQVKEETNDQSHIAISDDIQSPEKIDINGDNQKSDSENDTSIDDSCTKKKAESLSPSPINNNGDAHSPQALKRKLSAPIHARKAKFPKRLEDTVAKLKQRSEAQNVNIANNQ